MTERTSDAEPARTVTRGMPSNGDVAGPVSIDLLLPGTVEAPSVARHALRHWMDGLDCPDEFVEDAVLLVSEVVTNAVVHASSAPRLLVTVVGDRLRIEVHDMSRALPVMQASSAAIGGRGLRIVDQLADAWGTAMTSTGKVVWSEQHLPAGLR